MTLRRYKRRVPRASQCVSAFAGGTALRLRAGTPAWQCAGNGMNDGSGRVSAARSAMR